MGWWTVSRTLQLNNRAVGGSERVADVCEPALPAVSIPRLRPNMADAPPCCVDLDRSGEDAFDHAVGLWANRVVAPGMTTPVPAPSGWKCSHPRAASGDGHGAVPVRAQHGRPTGPQLRE